MKNKLLLSGLAIVSLTATAQQLQDGDIRWPNSQKLAEFVNAWTPGEGTRVSENGTGSVNPSSSGELFEDENFFISRVKLKPIIERNVATQVDGSYDDTNDKRLVNWVPVNHAYGVHTDALPNALFESEVFSNWSYVSHWGDWISPYGWVPAALADAAHKHGVLVSGVASIPYNASSIDTQWGATLDAIGAFDSSEQNKQKLAQFLYYHGVDGLGYNSEFSGGASQRITKLQSVHKYLMNWFKGKNQEFENIWYDGTNDNGSLAFDKGLTDHNDGNFSGSSLFWNYNWNNTRFQISDALANRERLTPDRSSFYLYAGHNMQGGEPGGTNWTILKRYPISIGLWGAHNTNMLWPLRTKNGTSPKALQAGYQKVNEQWFTNGNRNPVKTIAIKDRSKFQPDDDFFGMSAYMTAKSTLGWDLTTEPFVTFFNLGNGLFMNWKGERQHDIEWYNLGVQDYMPTWRWWFTSKFLGKNATDVPENGLDAQFTWDDAYMGGSCLNIFGSVDKEYLHLFKTKFAVQTDDVITVRYKLLGGKANAKLAVSVVGSESQASEIDIFTTDQEVDDEWVEFKYEVGGRDAFTGQELAVIALGFDNAEDLNLYIGEISIVRGSATTPAAPKITKTKTLRNNINGVDAKVIFEMENSKEAGDPCYNLDVNTSLFKLYAQVNGQTKLMGITSSWAGLLFRIPVGTADTYKIGVSAVSTDFATESPITWSGDISVGDYTISEDIVLSQNVIKPGEAFSIGYADQKHAAAKWEITNAKSGENIRTEESATLVEFPDGISKVDPYNVKVTEAGNKVRQFDWMIQITDEAAGAVPKINDITLNSGTSEVEIEPNDVVEVTYTGRKADGSSTRALSNESSWIGGDINKVGKTLGTGQSFSVAGWVKFNTPDPLGTSAFFSIEDRTVGWPQSNWGWFWSNINGDGGIGSYTFRTSYAGGSTEIKYYFPDTKIPLGVWTHIAIVFEYTSNRVMRSHFFVNGIEQNGTWEAGSTKGTAGPNGTYCTIPNTMYGPDLGMWFSFFGGRGDNQISDAGLCDDLQVWDKAMTAEDVQTSMALDRNALPDGVLCYWDFESDEDFDFETKMFKSLGKTKNAPAGQFSMVKNEEESTKQNKEILTQTLMNPTFSAGNPFIKGSAYKVETKPTFSSKRAIITNVEGSDTVGSAKVTYKHEGDYTLTLTLANDYGSDTRDYPVITVGEDQGGEEPDPENPGTDPEDPNTDPEDPGQSGIADLNSDNLRTYTVNDVLYVEFATSGNYDVAVYNVNGSLVAQRADAAIAGQTMRINLGAAGVYVVRVTKDGGKAQGFKVLRK